MLVRSVRLTIGALLIAAAVAGCSSSGGDDADKATTTTTEATSTTADQPSTGGDDFATQANAICSAGNEGLRSLGADIDESSSEEELQTFLEGFLASIRGQLDDIEALDVPADQAADVDEFISTARTALDDIEAQGPSALMSATDPFTETNELANALGLTECGSS